MKRISAFILTLITILSVLTSCTQRSNDKMPDSTLPPQTSTQATTQPVTVSHDVPKEINPYLTRLDIKAYLTETEEKYFHKAVDGILYQKSEIFLSPDPVSNMRVYQAIKNNIYFFLTDTLSLSNDKLSFEVTYKYSMSEQFEKMKWLNNEIMDILNSVISPGMNDLDKALALYSYFAKRISYDRTWFDGLKNAGSDEDYSEIYAYRALKTNTGVCHSYTYLYEFCLLQMNMVCLEFAGEMTQADDDEGHMWPVIQIDGKYYHCDPTWDRVDNNSTSLNYFGMTDDERIKSGIENFETCYDSAYGKVVCDSKIFSPFRGVISFEFSGEPSNHIILLHYADRTQKYNTQTMKIISDN